MKHIHNVLTFDYDKQRAFYKHLSNLILSQLESVKEANKKTKAEISEEISITTNPLYLSNMQGRFKAAHISQLKESILGNVAHNIEHMNDTTITEKLGYLLFTAPTSVVFKFTDNTSTTAGDIEDLINYYNRIVEVSLAEIMK